MALVMGVSDHVVVLDAGQYDRRRAAEAVRRDPHGEGGLSRQRPDAGARRAQAAAGATPRPAAARRRATSARATARAAGAAGHRPSRCARASWSRCWAPTARASPPPMRALSAACCRPVAGSVCCSAGARSSAMAAHAIAAAGLALVPEGRQVFPELSVRRQPPASAPTRARPPTSRPDIERLLRALPAPARAPAASAAACSPAASSRCCAIARGLMAQPARAAAGRAVARPCAGHHRRAVRR